MRMKITKTMKTRRMKRTKNSQRMVHKKGLYRN
jgi:hypothetical protein